MNRVTKHELYDSPQVEIIEMNAVQVICTSQQNAGNQGYGSNNYDWGN